MEGFQTSTSADINKAQDISFSEEIQIETETQDIKNKRAMARERFLRLLLVIQRKQVTFDMYENTKVTTTFEGCDSGFQKIAVSNLVTPVAVHNVAYLRTSDILSFTVDLN